MSQIQCSKCLEYKDVQNFGFRIEGTKHLKSWCYACQEISASDWRARNDDRVKANKRIQYLRRRHIKLHGVSPCCEICGIDFNLIPQDGSKLNNTPHWDHNHGTEEFRGWLCHNHNAMLGHAGDNPEVLRAGAEYLEKHGCTPTQNLFSKLQRD